MQPRSIARAIAVGRVAIGAAFVAAPEGFARSWVGRDARRAGTQVFVAGLGARDLVLGLGVLTALKSGGARPWLAASAAADVVDLLATLRARGDIPGASVAGIGLIAGGSAVLGAWLTAQEDW